MKKIQTIVVDTLNAVQNNQYMGLLDKGTMVTREKWKDFGVDIYMFMVEDLQNMGFEVVLVLGHEGTGKSFGIKYLEPGTNIWFNPDRKSPTFREVEFNNKKYSAKKVYGTKRAPTQFMQLTKSYQEITEYIKVIKEEGALADVPVAFLLGHIDDYAVAEGDRRRRFKTLGSLATKMNIEGSVEYCLYSKIDVQGETIKYMFDTQNDGTNTGRSSEGAFPTRYIDNNFHTVYDAIINY